MIPIARSTTGACNAPLFRLARSEIFGPFTYKHCCSVTEVSDCLLTRSFDLAALSETAIDPSAFEADFQTAGSLQLASLVPFTRCEVGATKIVLSRNFVAGCSLMQSVQAGGPLDLPLLLHISSQVARTIRYAHSVNRPLVCLRPSNVIYCQDGSVRIVDCAISGFVIDIVLANSPTAVLFLGPEGCNGDFEPTPELDLWAFGILLYFMATGKLPFFSDNLTHLIQNMSHISEDAFAAVKDDTLRRIVAQLLVADPVARATIGKVCKDITGYRMVAKKPSVARPTGLSIVRSRTRESRSMTLTALTVLLRSRPPDDPAD
jgi:serine/threonine protein kinase